MASPPCSPHSNRCRKEAAGIKGNALGMGRPISAKTEIHQVCFAELKDRAVEAMEIHGNRYVIEHHQRGVSHIHLLPDEHVGARGVSMEIDEENGQVEMIHHNQHKDYIYRTSNDEYLNFMEFMAIQKNKKGELE